MTYDLMRGGSLMGFTVAIAGPSGPEFEPRTAWSRSANAGGGEAVESRSARRPRKPLPGRYRVHRLMAVVRCHPDRRAHRGADAIPGHRGGDGDGDRHLHEPPACDAGRGADGGWAAESCSTQRTACMPRRRSCTCSSHGSCDRTRRGALRPASVWQVGATAMQGCTRTAFAAIHSVPRTHDAPQLARAAPQRVCTTRCLNSSCASMFESCTRVGCDKLTCTRRFWAPLVGKRELVPDVHSHGELGVRVATPPRRPPASRPSRRGHCFAALRCTPVGCSPT